MSRVAGKVAVVTGAASGIGAATAKLLAEHGASVVLADVDQEGLDARTTEITAAGGTVLGVRADIGDEAELERLFATTTERFGGVDVLHNNAFPISLAVNDVLPHEAQAGTWDGILHTGVTGTVLATRFALVSMLERGGGSIVNTASLSGMLGDAKGNVAYAASKAAILSLTRSTATLYGKLGVRCNAVSPGHIQTPPMLEAFAAQLSTILEHYPAPRLGTPADIANIVLFLASDESAYVNGHNLVADGGFSVPMATFSDHIAEFGPSAHR